MPKLSLRTWLETIGVGLFVILLTLYSVNEFSRARMAYDLSVQSSNIRALQDASKKLATKYDSTLSVQHRLVEQGAIREKALGGALGEATENLRLVTRAVNTMQVKFEQVRKVVEATGVAVTDPVTGDGRKYEFPVTGPPISGTVAVTAPRDTTSPAVMDARLTATPFAIRTSLSCGRNKDVNFLVETPPWVMATIERGTVEPEVCHGKRPSWRDMFSNLKAATTWGTTGLLVGTGLGLMLAK